MKRNFNDAVSLDAMLLGAPVHRNYCVDWGGRCHLQSDAADNGALRRTRFGARVVSSTALAHGVLFALSAAFTTFRAICCVSFVMSPMAMYDLWRGALCEYYNTRVINTRVPCY